MCDFCWGGYRPHSWVPLSVAGAVARLRRSPRHSNFARNSSAACSNIEFVSLELQRFRAVSKNDRGKLCAKFVWRWPRQRVLALPTGRSPHRGLALRFLRRLPHGACCAVGLAPTLPRVRYKILPAWLLGGENGTKLSLHAQIAPHWAISGEQGEFCTGSGAVQLVLGEFCTGGAWCVCCWASCVVLWRSPRAGWRVMAAPWRCSWASRPGPPCHRRSLDRWPVGFALHEALLRRVTGVSRL